MKLSIRRSLPVTAALVFGATPLAAQAPAPPNEPVDRIIAVVGDSIVLQTDIQEELLRMALAGRQIPEDPVVLEALRRQILESKVDELLLVQAAQRDSVEVPAEEIEALVEQDIARRRGTFPSEAAFVQALRQEQLNLPQYREMLTQQYRRNAVIQRYVAQALRQRDPPPVTEEAIREFFEANRAQLGQRPATITFEQVVVPSSPSDSARAAAVAEAERVLQLLREGEEFEVLARRFSDDPGTREQGGDLGWFRRGDMAVDFENAAFALRPGQISGVVESSFGFHIIKVERIRGAERTARHILIRPELIDADIERARALAETVADSIRAGAPVDDMVDEYGDPDEQSRVGPYPRDQLPGPYTGPLTGVDTGDVAGPIRLPGVGTADKWAVVKVTDVSEAGQYTLDDVRTRIRQQLERQKMLEELVRELRQRTYIDIRV